MSGGHFNYQQYRLHDMAEAIGDVVKNNENKELNSYGQEIGRFYPEDIIEKFNETIDALLIAEAMVQRVDWLLSDDDGEDSFRKRWVEEVGSKQ